MGDHDKPVLSNDEIERLTPNELAEQFLPLALSMAGNMFPGDPDARQDASLALVEATRTYKAGKGPFAPWAALYIKRTLRRGRHLREHVIRIPQTALDKLSLLLAAQDEIAAKKGDITLSDLVEATGLEESEVSAALNLPNNLERLGGPGSGSSGERDGHFGWESSRSLTRLTGVGVESDLRLMLADLILQFPEAAEEAREWFASDGSDDGMREIVERWWPKMVSSLP